METYTTDVAEGMIRYGVQNGLDAWRTAEAKLLPKQEAIAKKVEAKVAERKAKRAKKA